MAVVKDRERGTWRVSTYYKDWTGKQCKKTKRGFKTKHEAQDWESAFGAGDTLNTSKLTAKHFILLLKCSVS